MPSSNAIRHLSVRGRPSFAATALGAVVAWLRAKSRRSAFLRLRKSRPLESEAFLDSETWLGREPGKRAVPISAKQLTAVLDRCMHSRAAYRYLATVEHSLRTVGADALGAISPWLLDHAIRELEELPKVEPKVRRDSNLAALLLQMRRQACEHHARAQEARAAVMRGAYEQTDASGVRVQVLYPARQAETNVLDGEELFAFLRSHSNNQVETTPMKRDLDAHAQSAGILVARYQRALAGVLNTRSGEIDKLLQLNSEADGPRRTRLAAWQEEQLDGFRLLVLGEAAHGPAFAPYAADAVDREAVAFAERWLSQAIDQGDDRVRLAAILFFEEASTEVLTPEGDASGERQGAGAVIAFGGAVR